MKRNWIVIAFMSLLTVALWAQTAATTTAAAGAVHPRRAPLTRSITDPPARS